MQQEKEYTYLEFLKNGEVVGLEGILSLYKDIIFPFCLKFIRQQTLAEEATADVFIQLWKNRDKIDVNRTVKPLLFKIAKDTAYNYLKKIASQDRLKEQYIQNYASTEALDAEKIYLGKEQMEELEKVIKELPPQRQMIFRMRYLEGKNNKVIAAELELSPHTVKAQLVKARQFVREQIQIEEGGDYAL